MFYLPEHGERNEDCRYHGDGRRLKICKGVGEKKCKNGSEFAKKIENELSTDHVSSVAR